MVAGRVLSGTAHWAVGRLFKPAVVLIDVISSEPLAVADENGLRTLRKPLNAQDLLAAILELIPPRGGDPGSEAEPAGQYYAAQIRISP